MPGFHGLIDRKIACSGSPFSLLTLDMYTSRREDSAPPHTVHTVHIVHTGTYRRVRIVFPVYLRMVLFVVPLPAG